MRSRVGRRLLALVLAAVWCAPAAGDDFKCDDISGCNALNTSTGSVITFRKGDIVSTERGFVVAGDNGWVGVD